MMKKFNILMEKREEEGVTLRFYSKESIKLIIKDIKYFYSPTEKDLSQIPEILSVILDNNAKLEYFKFPDKNKEYSSISFLIKEPNKFNNILAVRVDLKTNDVQIKETDFKI